MVCGFNLDGDPRGLPMPGPVSQAPLRMELRHAEIAEKRRQEAPARALRRELSQQRKAAEAAVKLQDKVRALSPFLKDLHVKEHL